MPDIRLLLVAREGEARQAYEATLERLGIEFDAVSSFGSIPSLAGEKAYNGLLLDILTLVRTPSDEKNIAYECINYYPSTRIKWDSGSRQVVLLGFDQAVPSSDDSALKLFIERHCMPFRARTVRKSPRKEMVLNTLLASAVHSADTSKFGRTFSVNVSCGGAFIHTVDDFSRGDTVWLQFEELFDRAVVRGEVCWRQEWGVRRTIAGIGIQFVGLSEEQEAELKKLLKG